MFSVRSYATGAKMSNLFQTLSPISGNVGLGIALPPVNITEDAVLYKPPKDGYTNIPPDAYVATEKDIWDLDHVRMPCSEKSYYSVENHHRSDKRWNMIWNALNKPIENFEDLHKAILKYNHKFRGIWTFQALKKLFNEHWTKGETEKFFKSVLPKIVHRALELPVLVQKPIPLLKRGMNKSISLSQLQISSLMANAFFCTFPKRNYQGENTEYHYYPQINFSRLYQCDPANDPVVLEKLTCLINYLTMVCYTGPPPTGVVTFTRRHVEPDGCPRWWDSPASFDIPVLVDADIHIENARGLIQLDFANKYLGGGVLGRGCVQEEIRFIAYPELMVSMLFTERMADTEAVMMIGAVRYNNYTGYGDTFKFTDSCYDTVSTDSSHRAEIALLAIDALYYRKHSHEYDRKNLRRELDKAWVGFSFPTRRSTDVNYPGVATGNWGCGAFNGTPQLKSLLQLMACAQARRPMAYFTFHDESLKDGLRHLHQLLINENIQVGTLYDMIANFNNHKKDLFSYLIDRIVKLRQKTRDAQEQDRAQQEQDKTSPDTRSYLKKQQNDSPDLFSQDEDQSVHTGRNIKVRKQSNTKTSQDFMDLATSILNSTDTDDKETNSEKTVHDKMAPNTSSRRQSKMAATDQNVTHNRNNVAIASSKASHTSRLFDEMQKFDDDNGRLKLPANYSVAKRANVEDSISLSSLDSEQSTGKKRKITDYFSRNTT